MSKSGSCLLVLALMSGLSGTAGAQAPGAITVAPGLRPATAMGDAPAVAHTAETSAGRRVMVSLPAGRDAVQLGPRGPGQDGAPAMVALPDGGFLVVAARWRAGGAELWAQQGDANGWSRARGLRRGGASDHHPAMAVGRRATWLVWVSEDGAGTSFLVAAEWDGSQLSVPERLPAVGGSPGLPAIAVDANEQPAVVWSAYDGTDTEVWISRRTALGWSTPTPLTDNEVPDELPDIGRGRAARLVVSWGGYSPTGYQPFATHELPNGRFAAGTRLDDHAAGVTSVLGGASNAIAWTAIMPTTFELRVAAQNSRGWQSAAQLGEVGSSRVRATLRGETLLATTGGTGYAVGRLLRSDLARHPGADLGLPPVPEQPALKAAAPTLPGTYRGFGDSITEGVVRFDGIVVVTSGYPEPLATYVDGFLGRNGIVVENRGLGGELTADGLGRLVGLNATTPKFYTFIMEGANDVISLIDANTVATNLRGMVRNTHAAGGIAVLSTVTPRTTGVFEGGLNPRIVGYNELIVPMARQEGALLVDQWSAFYRKAHLYSDQLHPNAQGYVHMAQTWFRGLQPLFTALLQNEDDELAAARDAARAQARAGRQRPGPGQ